MKGDIKEREMFGLYTHIGRQYPVIKSSNVVDVKCSIQIHTQNLNKTNVIQSIGRITIANYSYE
jgi:hypothetical protein